MKSSKKEAPASNEAPPDVLGPAEKMALILSEDPQGVDKDSFKRGDRLLVIFNDPNYGRKMKGLPKYKIEVIMQAIDDLSGRGKILAESYLGVSFRDNKLQTFSSAYSESPKGSVIFKVGIKNIAAFQNWRNGAIDEIGQDDINAAIYRLTVEWSYNL